MTKVDVQGKKRLYKTLLFLLKIIPMLLALCEISNTFLAFAGVSAMIPSFIGGMSFLPLVFLYLASYAFQFCEYHRMFLHYVLVTNALNIYDLYIGLPVSTANLMNIHCVLVGALLFLVLYFYRKERCCRQ